MIFFHDECGDSKERSFDELREVVVGTVARGECKATVTDKIIEDSWSIRSDRASNTDAINVYVGLLHYCFFDFLFYNFVMN